MPSSATLSLLSLSRSVLTVRLGNVVMPRARRGEKAKDLAAWADFNAQLLQEPPVGTSVQAPPVDPTTTQVDNDPNGLADLGVTGPAGMVRS